MQAADKFVLRNQRGQVTLAGVASGSPVLTITTTLALTKAGGGRHYPSEHAERHDHPTRLVTIILVMRPSGVASASILLPSLPVSGHWLRWTSSQGRS